MNTVCHMRSKHPLFEGVTYRMGRAAKITPPACQSLRISSTDIDASCPIVISSSSDPTAIHFVQVSKFLERKLNWVTYEDLLTDLVLFEKIRAIWHLFPGVYLRYATPASQEANCLLTAMEALTIGHCNTIKPSPSSTNPSKPYHGSIIRFNSESLKVPNSKITSQVNRGHDWIVKGMSSLPTFAFRSDSKDWPIQHAPYFVQKRILGTEIRAHVVEDKVYATRISSESVDYRREGNCSFATYSLPYSIELDLVHLARVENLRFCGIDIIEAQNGKTYVLEVNPMPGYHGYESQEAPAISEALLNLLYIKKEQTKELS